MSYYYNESEKNQKYFNDIFPQRKKIFEDTTFNQFNSCHSIIKLTIELSSTKFPDPSVD